MLPCAYKQLLGIDCPACGAQRSFDLLVHGKLSESFFMYPPLLPVLFLMGFWAARLLKPQWVNLNAAKKYSIVVLVMVMINYIMHLIIS